MALKLIKKWLTNKNIQNSQAKIHDLVIFAYIKPRDF